MSGKESRLSQVRILRRNRAKKECKMNPLVICDGDDQIVPKNERAIIELDKKNSTDQRAALRTLSHGNHILPPGLDLSCKITTSSNKNGKIAVKQLQTDPRPVLRIRPPAPDCSNRPIIDQQVSMFPFLQKTRTCNTDHHKKSEPNGFHKIPILLSKKLVHPAIRSPSAEERNRKIVQTAQDVESTLTFTTSQPVVPKIADISSMRNDEFAETKYDPLPWPNEATQNIEEIVPYNMSVIKQENQIQEIKTEIKSEPVFDWATSSSFLNFNNLNNNNQPVSPSLNRELHMMSGGYTSSPSVKVSQSKSSILCRKKILEGHLPRIALLYPRNRPPQNLKIKKKEKTVPKAESSPCAPRFVMTSAIEPSFGKLELEFGRITKSVRRHKCDFCSVYYKSLTSLWRHQRLECGSLVASNRKCPQCPMIFVHPYNLAQHIAHAHPENP